MILSFFSGFLPRVWLRRLSQGSQPQGFAVIAFGGFVGIAFSRSRCPHVLGDLSRIQGIAAAPACRNCCSCIFQDYSRFPGPVDILSVRIAFTSKDLSEFHISALAAFAFSVICWSSKFRDLFQTEGLIPISSPRPG